MVEMPAMLVTISVVAPGSYKQKIVQNRVQMRGWASSSNRNEKL